LTEQTVTTKVNRRQFRTFFPTIAVKPTAELWGVSDEQQSITLNTTLAQSASMPMDISTTATGIQENNDISVDSCNDSVTASSTTMNEDDADMLAAVADASTTLAGPIQNKAVSLILGPVPHNSSKISVIPLSSNAPPPLFG